MNVARSTSNGDNDGVVIPRDEAEALLEGLKEVLDANRSAE